jgi:hypothetical protein
MPYVYHWIDDHALRDFAEALSRNQVELMAEDG